MFGAPLLQANYVSDLAVIEVHVSGRSSDIVVISGNKIFEFVAGKRLSTVEHLIQKINWHQIIYSTLNFSIIC